VDVIIEWNPNVNQKLSLDGEYNLNGNNLVTLQFESGKERRYLKNSFTPWEYPELSLLLDNKTKKGSKTEFEEFLYWHETALRYGVLPFYFPRLRYPGETGVYEFMSMPKYTETAGLIPVSFGWREIAWKL
jgi:hypothetical protein